MKIDVQSDGFVVGFGTTEKTVETWFQNILTSS